MNLKAHLNFHAVVISSEKQTVVMGRRKMSKKGTKYELFVKEIYERLNAVDGLSDVRIQHDIKLIGAAGVEHQIDLYWTFSRGGVNYSVAIECKDYNSRVSKDRIQSFHDVLHDIGGLHGILVTKMGFQSGAKEYAQKYGIQLMEIRHPTDDDWKGKMRNLQLILELHSIDNVSPLIVVDKERVASNRVELSKINKLRIHAMSNQVFVEYDEMESVSFCNGLKKDSAIKSEKNTKSIYDLITMLPRKEAVQGLTHMFRFKNGVVHYSDEESNKTIELPVTQINFTYDVHLSKEKVEINGDDFIEAIVKNLSDGTQKTIDRFGQIENRL